MSDSRLQEIVTKAVVGRAERRMSWCHTVPAEGITGVLGVHVTDAAVAVKEKDRRAVVDVVVDLDLWCGNPKNTKVLRCTARTTENVDVRTFGHILGDIDLSTRLLESVRATGVSVGEGGIKLNMEADIAVTMSALTRLWVKAYDLDEDVLLDVEEIDDESSGTGSGSGSGSGE